MRNPLKSTDALCAFAFACISFNCLQGQGLSHDLYDRTGASFAPKGWTIGLGAAGLRAEPFEWEEIWLPGATLDTAVYGVWAAEAFAKPALALGRWWRFEQPVLWDRFGLEMHVSKREYAESFTSYLPDSAIWEGAGNAWLTALGAHGYRAIAFTPDLYLEGMLGIGADGLWGKAWSPAGPDSLFGTPPTDLTWRFAVEGGLAAGIRIWPGRFIRIALTTDLLQFAPMAENRGAAMDLLRQGYRPWTLGIRWDIQQERAPLACSVVVDDPYARREQFGTQLFGEDMRPKKKKKRKKRRKKNRKS